MKSLRELESLSGIFFNIRQEILNKDLRFAIRRCLLVLAPVLVAGMLMCKCSFAQTAQISGSIIDSSGAVVPNAKVTVLNNDTGIIRAAETDRAGYYAVPLLQPGNYMVTVMATGFATKVRPGILLEVGDKQVVNVTLEVGQITEKVVVTGAAPQVQLGMSSIGAVVNAVTVRELPLNGRSWTDLATLQPGVNSIQTQLAFDRTERGARGFGSQVSISGARPEQNDYRLDGISLNDYANGAPGSVLGGNLGVDAIDEFSVLTSNYSAEYGKTSGGVVNAVTRAGTNQFHGGAYEFVRNSALDARNFFDGSTIPPFKRNQFGASAGGPIQKDRTFIFGDYEGIRQSKGITTVESVPSAAARQGNLSTGTVTVGPSAGKYLAFYPLPNRGVLPPGDTGIFAFPAQEIVNENFATIRLDHQFSGKDSLSGTYVYDDTPFTHPDGLDNVLLGSHTNRNIIVLQETHNFSPSLINSVRFGFNRDAVINEGGIQAINKAATDQSLGAVPGRTASVLEVPELSQFTGGLGAVGNRYNWNSFQAYDDAFLSRGAQTLRFGVGVERMQLNSLAPSTPNGDFSFGSLADFLTDSPARFDAGFPSSNPTRGLRQTLLGLYLQDDWQWHRNLTLNLGLRYEIATVPTEVQGKLSTLIHLTDTQPHLGDPYFLNSTLHNFEPRVGFSWDPFHTGKTAVRGGFGMFDVQPLPYQFVLMSTNGAPFNVEGNVQNLPAGSFYAGAFTLLTPSTLGAAYVEHQPKRNYVMEWNLNIQHEVAPNLTAMIAYAESRGVHQPAHVDDRNIVIPTLTEQGYIWPSPAGSGTTINPNFGRIDSQVWGGNSFFDALELQVTKRMSHNGLQLQGSFTWGKSIDTSSAALAGDLFANGISSMDWYDLRLTRGLSDFNIGRTLVINAIWQVPTLNSLSGPLAYAAHGWELGAIYKVSDGVPFSATFGSDGDPLGKNNGDPWDFPNRLTGPGCQNLINAGNPNNYIKTQCFAIPTAPSLAFYTGNCDPRFGTFPQCFNLRGNAGRNILTGPGTSNVDFSIYKNNPVKRISENFNVQFRAEFFNILNRANFAIPVTPDNVTIFDSTGAPVPSAGLLTSTTTTAREIQFALKFIW